MSKTKKTVTTLWVDADLHDWLIAQGSDIKEQINAILRAYYEAHRSDAR